MTHLTESTGSYVWLVTIIPLRLVELLLTRLLQFFMQCHIYKYIYISVFLYCEIYDVPLRPSHVCFRLCFLNHIQDLVQEVTQLTHRHTSPSVCVPPVDNLNIPVSSTLKWQWVISYGDGDSHHILCVCVHVCSCDQIPWLFNYISQRNPQNAWLNAHTLLLLVR